jgi:hypothetical protein
MTLAGKILVFTILVFSLVFCTYAVVVFAGPVDVGWDAKHARKEFGTPVESELKKRQDTVKKLEGVRNTVLASWREARKDLARTAARVPENQVWYTYQLERIRTAGPVDERNGVLGLKTDAVGQLVLDLPRDKTGRPVFDPGQLLFDKTYVKYIGQLETLFNKIKALTDEKTGTIMGILKEEKRYTDLLNGEKEDGIKKKKGIYDLIDRERDIEQRGREELSELKPKYYQELVGSQDLLERQKELQLRVQQLKSLGVARR